MADKFTVAWFKQSIQINAGVVLDEAPEKIEFYEKHYEVTLSLGKDHTMSFYISESAIMEHPELFVAVKNDKIVNE